MPICYHSAYNNYIQNIKVYRAPNLNMIRPSENTDKNYHVCLSISLLLSLFNFFFLLSTWKLGLNGSHSNKTNKLEKASSRSRLSSAYSTSVVPKLIGGNALTFQLPYNYLCIFQKSESNVNI